MNYWQYSYATKSTYINDYTLGQIILLGKGTAKQHNFPVKDDMVCITHRSKLRVIGQVLDVVDDIFVIQLIQVFSEREAQRQVGFRRNWVKIQSL